MSVMMEKTERLPHTSTTGFWLIAVWCCLLWMNATQADEPKTTWQRSSPEEVGFDSAKLKKLDAYLRANTGTTGLVLIVNGRYIHNYGDVTEISYIASCRKSLLAMLYGKYVENGQIELKKTIGQLEIDDVGGLLPIEKKATVYDLITARSGVYHPAANAGGIPEGKEPPRGKTKPGTKFLYNNWDFNAAGTVFVQQTKIPIYTAFQNDIAIPIGMEDFDIKKQRYGGDKKKSEHLAYHFYLSTRDMARIGQLMLNKGKWDDEQIISKAWTERMTTIVSPLDDRYTAGYGIMWWRLRDREYPAEFRGAFSATGMYGQFITVFPALNLVVAHKSSGNEKNPTTSDQYRQIVHMVIQSRTRSRTAYKIDPLEVAPNGVVSHSVNW